MHVEVNEANIDRYNLAQLTGNSRETMLSEAAEAATQGYVLSCAVPDDKVLEQNVFDVYETEHVDPKRVQGCSYEIHLVDVGVEVPVCVVHGKTTTHDISVDPNAPCIQMSGGDDDVCVYWREATGRYICVKHHKYSDHDVVRNPNAPCKGVDE